MYFEKAFRLVGIAVLLVTVLSAEETTADVRIRQVFQTDAVEIMGQVMPATLDTNTIWLSGTNARLDAGDTASMILWGDSGKLVQLDHQNKQYSEIDLAATGETADPQVQQILGAMEIEIDVTPTDDTQKIGDWNCRKYIIVKQIGMMESTTEVWASTDIEINNEAYHKILNSLMAYMPNYDKAMKQFAKIKGVTVKEETTAKVMGKEIRSGVTLIDAYKEDAPKDAFTIPEGYTKVPMQLPGGH